MISIIVCSRRPAEWNVHENNVRQTAGCPNEYIKIDNTGNTYGLCSAYNKGLEYARGEICVFMHEDVFMLQYGWGAIIENKFRNDESLGLIGVAGTQYLFADKPGWVAAGRPFIHGKVTHQKGENCILTVYSWDNGDKEVVAVDGLFIAVRGSLFERIGFDDAIFDKFHFYDLDICMQVRKTHKCIVTDEIVLKHFSGGSFDSLWKMYGDRFCRKYSDILPVSCIDKVPDQSPERFESYDITARIPEEVRRLGLDTGAEK
ncbi:MAG: hypothetical protein GF350_00430 [Chitinivibrionales bacterium]|nr:hypothetical protein [Chitinivibrionales bacterium]